MFFVMLRNLDGHSEKILSSDISSIRSSAPDGTRIREVKMFHDSAKMPVFFVDIGVSSAVPDPKAYLVACFRGQFQEAVVEVFESA